MKKLLKCYCYFLVGLVLLTSCNKKQELLLSAQQQQIDSLNFIVDELKEQLITVTKNNECLEDRHAVYQLTASRDSLLDVIKGIRDVYEAVPDTAILFSGSGPILTPHPPLEGLGIISVRTPYTNPLKLLNDSFQEIGEISFNKTDGLTLFWEGKKHTEVGNRNEIANSSFKPWLYNHDSDYFLLRLSCLDSTDTHYKVRFGEATTGYILKDDNKTRYINPFSNKIWWTGVVFDRIKTPLRTAPSNTAPVAKFCALLGEKQTVSIYGEVATIKEIRGEWINIKLQDEEGRVKQSYWIRWRNGNEVLVSLSFLC